MVRTVLLIPRLLSSMWSLQEDFAGIKDAFSMAISLLKALTDIFALIIVPAEVHSEV